MSRAPISRSRAGPGEALGDALCDGNRTRHGEAAVIEARAGDDVGEQADVGGRETVRPQRLPESVRFVLAHMREDEILFVRHANLAHRKAFREFRNEVHFLGAGIAPECRRRA